MSNVALAESPILFFLNNANQLNAGGSLLTQVGGVNYPTYQDQAGTIALPNPIPLNSRGEISNSSGVSCQLFLLSGIIYTFTLFDANGNQLWTADDVQAIAPVAVGNMTDEKGSGGAYGFVAGVDFTDGVTTSLTLSQNYGSSSNLWVEFDGVQQGADTFSLGGAANETLTFNAPIPVGTQKVYVKGGTALSIGTPGPGTVGDNQILIGSNLWYSVQDADVVPEMFGAKGDGVTDDTVALQAWLLNASPRSALNAKTYLCSQSLSINKTMNIRGLGMGQSIIKNTAVLATPVLHVTSGAANYTTLRDFTVTSSVTTSSGCNGIQVDGGEAFVLQNLEVTNTNGGIAIPAATSGAFLRDCFVHNVTGIGYQTDAANMLISGCYAINCGAHGFANTTTTGGSAGLTMSDCTAFNNGLDNFVWQGNASNSFIDLVVTNCVSSASPHGNGFSFNTYGKYITISNLFCELAGMSASDTFVSNQDGIYFSNNNQGAIAMSNIQVIGSSLSGIHMDCAGWTLNGAVCVANNAAGSASNGGVAIGVAGAVVGWSINGLNTLVPAGTSDSQAYAVNSFTSGNVGIVTGSILHGTTAAFNNVGGTATFANNLSL